MKLPLTFFISILLFFLGESTSLSAAAVVRTKAVSEVPATGKKELKKFQKKLTFKDKVALFLVKKAIKKQKKREAKGKKKLDFLAVLSPILGILGFITGLGILLAPAAIVTGIFALHRIKENADRSGKGLAIAGIVIGGAFLIIAVIAVADFIGGLGG